MTQEQGATAIPSRALEVWRRLYTRYALEPFPASVGPDVLKTIVPVTQADQLLQTPEIREATVTSSAGNIVTYHTVPAGERWEVYGYELERLAGDRTADQALIRMTNANMVINDFTAAAFDAFLAPQLWILPEGALMRARFTAAGATDGDWIMRVYILVQTFF